MSHIWIPDQEFNIRQVCASEILLADDINVAYIIGPKQSGKTSIAMSAFETMQMGLGFKNKGDQLEKQIKLMRAGIPKNTRTQEELLEAYASFASAFEEQKFLCPITEMMRSILERDERYKEHALTEDDDIRGNAALKSRLYLPRKAPFLLRNPNDIQGRSFPGFTIFDEAQNAYQHDMRELRHTRRRTRPDKCSWTRQVLERTPSVDISQLGKETQRRRYRIDREIFRDLELRLLRLVRDYG